MERKEIDILTEAARKGCAVVEKATHLVWTFAELAEARQANRFLGLTRLLPPDSQIEVSALYPGCMQMAGRMMEGNGYRVVGQTQHFVICAPEKSADSLQFLAGS
jgi:hypothetical protein